MLLAKWVAQDGEVIAGETESGRQELEQRVLELERRLGIGIRKSKKPETTESEAKEMGSDSRGKRFCIYCGALNDVDAIYCDRCRRKVLHA
jgi:ribosomal protein L40E